MSDTATEPEAPRGRLTVKRAMIAILAFQLGMAAVLAGSDFFGSLPQLLSPSRQPALDDPARPGDQVRRFRPEDLPARPRTIDPDRQTPIPDPGDMPTRLRFLTEGTEGLLTGEIAPGDAERFTDWLAEASGVTTIRLHSPGGSVLDALAIGRALRAAELATTMEPGDICLSACPYILAGGVTRSVPDDALVGVHQHYFGENVALPAFLAVEDIQHGQGEVMDYLDAMGIDVRIMQPALSTPPDEIYILLPEELEEYGITESSSVEE